MSGTVLYLHGFASSPASYKGQAYDAYLSERGYRVTRLDLRVPDRDGLRVSVIIDRVLAEARAHDRVAERASSPSRRAPTGSMVTVPAGPAVVLRGRC